MSKTYRRSDGGTGRQRRISARAVRRNPPDLRLLSKALLMQAADEAAALREAENSTPDRATPNEATPKPDNPKDGAR